MQKAYQQAFKKLAAIGQTDLLKYWQDLNEDEKAVFLNQIALLNVTQFRKQRKLISQKSKKFKILKPLSNFSYRGNQADIELGKQLISEGQVACLLLAGGQGTRLRFDGPKGLFPITVIKHKSLFELFAEKLKAASLQMNVPLKMAIMTSPLNDLVTRRYFKDHEFFGLKPGQITFFTQKMLPFLNAKGDLFLETKNQISQGPDGNGYALKYLIQEGIWQEWHNQGVNYVNTVLVDNPLADPFDPELIGFHHRKQLEVTIKATLKREEAEKVGVIVNINNKIRVVEYSEMLDAERSAKTATGDLKHRFANISLFCFTMNFIKSLEKKSLPLHCALKNAKYWDAKDFAEAWKFESFIFDVLPHSNHTDVLVYPQQECFAPLKNATGKDSLETVQQALQDQADAAFTSVTGQPPPNHPYELSQEFYYPTPDFLHKWKGRLISHGNQYIY